MLDKNPNDLNWKSKLEDLNNLPGEALADKDTTWEKLYGRLHEKPRVRLAWYWVAAAGILVAMAIPFLKADKEQAVVITTDPALVKSKKTIAPPVSPLKENELVNNTPSSNEKKKPIKLAKKTGDKQPSSNDMLKNEGIASIELSAQKNDIPRVETISQSPVLDKPAEATLALVPAKKKLKVVHINELGEPVEETKNTVLNTDYRSFQIRLINQEVLTGSSLSSSNTGFNIFKTRSTPSN